MKENDWRSTTSSLSQEVVDDICTKFDADSSFPACKTKHSIFAPDLFPLIKEKFSSEDGSTYDDVQLMLSQYQTDYEAPVSLGNGEQYFVSWYDLRGDGETAIVFFFNGEGRINEIIYHLGNQDE